MHRVRRRSPDLAETSDRRSPVDGLLCAGLRPRIGFDRRSPVDGTFRKPRRERARSGDPRTTGDEVTTGAH